MKGYSVAGIEIPDTNMAKAACELIRGMHSALLFNHSNRVFLFAVIIGEHRRLLFDAELLYAAALFHCIGLTHHYHRSQKRFEVDSADAAREFLKGYGCPKDDIGQVWDAIALHTTPNIAEHKSPLVALLAAGVEMALFGRHSDALKATDMTLIMGAYPKQQGFRHELLNILDNALAQRPRDALGTLSDDV